MENLGPLYTWTESHEHENLKGFKHENLKVLLWEIETQSCN